MYRHTEYRCEKFSKRPDANEVAGMGAKSGGLDLARISFELSGAGYPPTFRHDATGVSIVDS